MANQNSKFTSAAAYLFGSQDKGTIGPLSDYDFGILLNHKQSPSKYFSIKIDLLTQICRILHTDLVDLVLLNEANCNLAMSVIKGLLLFEHDTEARLEFELKVMREYKDREFYEKSYQSYLFKQILSEYV